MNLRRAALLLGFLGTMLNTGSRAILPVTAQGVPCQYVLGFLGLYEQIPAVMGACVENETPAPNGDSLQRTTNGLAVYRKADNFTAFTNGATTWVAGPAGVQQRSNMERFPWEGDAATAGLPLVGAGAYDPARVGIRLDPYLSGFSAPLAVTHAADGSGRLYVVEKRGVIKLATGDRVATTPFLDIQSLIRSSGSEQGLLGLAFHPRYAQNGLFYVDYTDTNGNTVVARYTARATRDSAAPESAQVLLRIAQPAANHNGGHLAFGPDGYLYIGTGDGGGAGDQFRNAQNTQVLLGKMLRLDVDRPAGNMPYGIPADNPYASGAGGNRPEIWAYGLRNPWRYTFDRGTGDLYIADVGQNVYEEINVQPAGSVGGQNYGWPRMEAAHCFPETTRCDTAGLTLSVAEYSHSDGCSVTGGYVYRGQAHPQLTGAYIFGDYCSGRIWTLYRPAGGQWVKTQAIQSPVQISSFGEDEAGELYVTGLSDGRVYRVAATAR